MRIKLDDVSADQGGEEEAELGWSHCLGFFELSEPILTTSKTGYVCKYPLTLFISQCINCLLHKTQNRELVMLQIHNTTLLKFHKISSFSPMTTSFCNTGGIYYNSCCFCNGVEYEFNFLSIPSEVPETSTVVLGKKSTSSNTFSLESKCSRTESSWACIWPIRDLWISSSSSRSLESCL